jgi:transcriptional regulator with XRE-family HTH domain
LSKDKQLTEEQKRFILKNRRTMSDRRMAKELGISRNEVNRYKQNMASQGLAADELISLPTLQKFFTGKNAKLVTVVAFLFILFLSLYIKRYTFNLSHIVGDQQHYVALAFKLDKEGISGYNLRGIDMNLDKNSPYLVKFERAKGKGFVLEQLAKNNVTYYDQPFHHIPFAFPMLIMLSHRIFASGEPYYLLRIPNESEIINQSPPGVGLLRFRFNPNLITKHLYAVIIPLMFSICLIILVYLLTKYLYDSKLIAFTAMFLMAISPIDILASQKIWADDMAAFFATLAIILYILGVDRKRPLFAFIGGVSCGLSAITKQTGAFIIFVIIIWHFIANADSLFKKESFLKVIFNKYLMLFSVGVIVSSGYWFFKVTSVYGNPFYLPHQENIGQVAKEEFFRIVGKRPRYVYFIGIPYQNPLFGLAYISFIWLWVDKKRSKKSLLLIIWIAVFLYILSVYLGSGGKEHRYMLPAYPAFAILGAYVANRIRLFMDRVIGFRIGTILLILILVISAKWSITMALNVVAYDGPLILKPF